MINSELGLPTRKQIGKMRWGTSENVYMESISMRMSRRNSTVLRSVVDIIQSKGKRKIFYGVGKLAVAG